jgi:hypothetical protein
MYNFIWKIELKNGGKNENKNNKCYRCINNSSPFDSSRGNILYFRYLLNSSLGIQRNYRSTFIQLIAAILFLIGGAIYLINEITRKDDALDVGLI